ncbi:MAG: nucleoside phosphorylase [Prevotellaceae bacterium]|jgi:uridine phosphorylase|nr:nucleoside phosphorylase [Prevotellaceae bacterium]
MAVIPSSELIINSDGSVFHLHLRPEDIADTIILVGDPARVNTVAGYFDTIEVEKTNREFVSKTGYIGNNRLSVLSTGIGTDNIDIVMTELDALANVDFDSRTVKQQHHPLRILRLGTSGALHGDIPLGSIIMSDISVGFDGLLNFYANRDSVSLETMEKAFIEHTNWNKRLADPYFVPASRMFVNLFDKDAIHGITISAPGFYGPQGRVVRLGLADPDLLSKIESFRYDKMRINNFEMESSAIAGLSLLLGHQAATICTAIANRYLKETDTDYKILVKRMIEKAIEKLIS